MKWVSKKIFSDIDPDIESIELKKWIPSGFMKPEEDTDDDNDEDLLIAVVVCPRSLST